MFRLPVFVTKLLHNLDLPFLIGAVSQNLEMLPLGLKSEKFLLNKT